MIRARNNRKKVQRQSERETTETALFSLRSPLSEGVSLGRSSIVLLNLPRNPQGGSYKLNVW